MSTAITTPQPALAPSAVIDGDQCVELRGIGWKGYGAVLRLRGHASIPRLIYLDGDLILMSPALPHEDLKRRAGFLIDQIIFHLDIPCRCTGQTTFRRRKKRGGVEGDITYYIANEHRVRGKKSINLKLDPPPDLAIEIVNTHPAEAALKVYQRLGVPEVWVCEDDGVRFLVQQADGQYAESATSLAFPFLTLAEVEDWLLKPYGGLENDWLKEVHRWVIEVLVPRVRRPQ